jgi:putative tryptophan/tyrosine transport system substrate-binding protein
MTTRRTFIAGLGAPALWPLAPRAQQALPRVVYFPNAFPDDPEAQDRRKAFREGLERLGWKDGSNVRINEQWGTLPAERMRSVAAEVVHSAPAVVLASGTPLSEALKLESRSVPIVFVGATDPAASGLVTNMAHPGENLTGFTNYEFSIGGKWLGLLKEAAPAVRRMLMIGSPGNLAQQGILRVAQAAAPALGIQVASALINSAPEIEREIDAFAKEANGGLIGLPGNPSLSQSSLIIALAARNRLPALYTHQISTRNGGLMSYDTDVIDLWRRAAGYVDRILKGERPGDLPVQLPTKYDLVINVRAAKAIGLTIPDSLLLRADEVIE